MSRVRVRLKTHGMGLEFQGREELFTSLVDPILKRLAGGGPVRDARPAAPQASPGANGQQTRSDAKAVGYRPPTDMFSLFSRRRDPRDDGPLGRIAAYAFFLWNYEKREVIRRDEVEGCFVADGIEVPQDVEEAYGELERRRILLPEDDAHGWRLSPKGVDLVRRRLRSA